MYLLIVFFIFKCVNVNTKIKKENVLIGLLVTNFLKNLIQVKYLLSACCAREIYYKSSSESSSEKSPRIILLINLEG